MATIINLLDQAVPVDAKILRFGFFDGSKQFLHICNIKIITSSGLQIQKACEFSQTSTASQSPGQLKHILVDDINTTFSHTSNNLNERLVVDFQKVYSIKQIIIENRNDATGVRDRIINAQFRLYDGANKMIWESDKIKTGNQYYHIIPSIDPSVKTVFTGQPSEVAKKVDPTDPCNNPLLMKEKPNLASACACQKASNSYSDQVDKYVVAQQQVNIDKTYNDSVLGPATDAWTTKTGDYKNWGTVLANLSNEERLFKNCQAGSLYSPADWAYTCVKDNGTGWQYVVGGDALNGCWPSTKGKCKRTANQINIDLNTAGYSSWKPPSKTTIITPAAPASTPITCCSQSFENISAGGNVNFSGVSQSCTTEIKNQIKEALTPPPPPVPAPGKTPAGPTPAPGKTPAVPTPVPAPPVEESESEPVEEGEAWIIPVVAVLVVAGLAGLAYVATKKSPESK